MLIFGSDTGFGVGGTPAVGAAVVLAAALAATFCGFFWK
jgi:hypothetical protein